MRFVLDTVSVGAIIGTHDDAGVVGPATSLTAGGG